MKPKSRKEDLVVQELNGEVLIYDLRTDKAFCLNETSAVVWNLCDGKKDISEISRNIAGKLNSKADEDLVWLALDQLKQQELLSKETELTPPFANMSRRDVVKKIGLSTAIALPVVFSLVAPKAILAQTTCAPTTGGCTCATQANGGGANGALCSNVLSACANPTCRCFKANNSGNPGSGNCVP